MLRVEIVRSAQALEPLRGVWDRLYHAGGYSIFQSPEWNLLAARAFAGRAETLVIHAESDAGAAIVPACLVDGQVSFLGDVLSDYRDVLAAGDGEVLRRAWQQIAAVQRPFSIAALRGEQARGQWESLGFAPALFCGAPGVGRADLSADVFAARHARAARLLRRLARAGVEFAVHSGAEGPLVRYIYERKAQQPGLPENLFTDRDRVDFLVAAAALGSCEVFTLETRGSLVAALLTFREERVRRFYTTYYDHAWAHHSPGNALLMEVTRLSLEQGLDCDYMTGEQPHKLRFATHGAPLFRVEAQPGDLERISHFRPAVEGENAPRQIAA